MMKVNKHSNKSSFILLISCSWRESTRYNGTKISYAFSYIWCKLIIHFLLFLCFLCKLIFSNNKKDRIVNIIFAAKVLLGDSKNEITEFGRYKSNHCII
jgi:hypothetical protein